MKKNIRAQYKYKKMDNLFLDVCLALPLVLKTPNWWAFFECEKLYTLPQILNFDKSIGCTYEIITHQAKNASWNLDRGPYRGLSL